jgi:hypothetical protein
MRIQAQIQWFIFCVESIIPNVNAPGCCLEARQSAAKSGLEFLKEKKIIAKQLLQQCQNTSMTSSQLSIDIPVR